MTRPPLHALPLDEFQAKLRTHTNLRVVPAAAAPDGYRAEPEPFPGRASPPQW